MHAAPLTVWIGAGLLRGIAEEADRARPDETGGILLGYRNGQQIVVRAVVDAGPRARRWATGMTPDADYQAAAVEAAFTASEGALTYLGDWHSHPGVQAVPSRRDRKTLRVIAADPEAMCAEPLMLILGDGLESWAPTAWVARLGRLGRWGPLSVRRVEIRPFDDVAASKPRK